MKLVVAGPNLPNSAHGETFHVHVEGCKDLKRAPYARRAADVNLWEGEYVSAEAVAAEVYADQIGEGSMTVEDAISDIYFAPCTERLPQDQAEVDARRTDLHRSLLDMKISEWRKTVDVDPLALFTEKMKTYTDGTQGFGWYAQDLLDQEARRYWLQWLMADIDANMVESLSGGEHDSRETVIKRWLVQLTKAVMRGAQYPARSTSTMSNLAEQAKATQAAILVEEVSWVDLG